MLKLTKKDIMKFEVGKLYRVIKKVEFIPENFMELRKKIPSIFVKKGVVVFLHEGKLVIPCNSVIDNICAHEYFKKVS